MLTLDFATRIEQGEDVERLYPPRLIPGARRWRRRALSCPGGLVGYAEG